MLTLWTNADICALTSGYPNTSVSEGGPIARVTVDGTEVAETHVLKDHATASFRATPTPVVLPAGSHTIQVSFTNPAQKANPPCTRRLYVDRIELSAPWPPLERLIGLGLLGGGSSAEQTAALPLSRNPDGSVQWRVIYSQPLPNLKKGEVLEARAEVELRNPHSYVVATPGRFILADRPDQVVSEPNSTIILLGGSMSENISPEMYRVARSRVASYTAKATYTQPKYLNYVMYAAADNPVGTNDTVDVGASTGRLNVLRYTPLDK